MGEELSVTKSAQSEIPKLEQHAKITTVRPAPSVPGRELGQSFSVPINISQAITPYAAQIPDKLTLNLSNILPSGQCKGFVLSRSSELFFGS